MAGKTRAVMCVVAWVVLASICGCGDDGGSTGDGGVSANNAQDAGGDTGADTGGDTSGFVEPSSIQRTTHAINVIDPAAADQVARFLRSDPEADLDVALQAFYALYPDDYDFVYLITPSRVDQAAAGRFRPIHRDPIVGIGIDAPVHATDSGSPARLKGVVALNINDFGNGPTLHETLHYWGVYLNEGLGLGRDRDRDWGAHWGVSSANGQLGGFDATTLVCRDAADSLPCAADDDGTRRYRVASFNPNSNGGDTRPFSTWELYLMGLVDAQALQGTPLVVLDEAAVVEVRDDDTMDVDATGFREVTVNNLISLHGERAPWPEDARMLKAAFVVFSAEPVDGDVLDVADNWSKVFGGERESFVIGFEEATGGRAQMDTRLGRLIGEPE